MRAFLLFSLFFCWGFLVSAQPETDSPLTDFNVKRVQLTRTGMYVLGSWAVGNLLVGSIGWSQTSGSTRYFHQGNALWNTVNLGLAGFTLYSLAQTDPASLSLAETWKEEQRLEKLLLFNAGLDIAYITGGFYLRERSLSSSSNRDRFYGYGNALILQGSFLLAFDTILYLVLHRHTNHALFPLLEHVSIHPQGIGLHWQF